MIDLIEEIGPITGAIAFFAIVISTVILQLLFLYRKRLASLIELKFLRKMVSKTEEANSCFLDVLDVLEDAQLTELQKNKLDDYIKRLDVELEEITGVLGEHLKNYEAVREDKVLFKSAEQLTNEVDKLLNSITDMKQHLI